MCCPQLTNSLADGAALAKGASTTQATKCTSGTSTVFSSGSVVIVTWVSFVVSHTIRHVFTEHRRTSAPCHYLGDPCALRLFAVQACLLIRTGYTTSTTKHIKTAELFGVRQCNNVFLMYVSLKDADACVGRATLGFTCTPRHESC